MMKTASEQKQIVRQIRRKHLVKTKSEDVKQRVGGFIRRLNTTLQDDPTKDLPQKDEDEQQQDSPKQSLQSSYVSSSSVSDPSERHDLPQNSTTTKEQAHEGNFKLNLHQL